MNIANEIQIHDAIGNATLIGGQAIRVGLSPHFYPPNIAGYHLYNCSTLIETVANYDVAITTAQTQNLIVVWRNDLNSPNASL